MKTRQQSVTQDQGKKKRVSKKYRKGDLVIAIAGNYKGQSGKIISIDGEKVVVQGLNIRKKHVKRSEQMPKGGILELEKPIHISNLRVCTNEDVPLKLKVKRDEKGERVLYYKEGERDVTYRSLKKHNP